MMTVLTEVDNEIARNMEKKHYKVYKFGDKFLVKDSDLDNYTEELLDEEFDMMFDY